MKNKKPQPITKKEEIVTNPDHKIDEDFKGFPRALASEKIIHPRTKTEKRTAAIDSKDGEKREDKK